VTQENLKELGSADTSASEEHAERALVSPTGRKRLRLAGRHVVVLMILAFVTFPFAWMVVSSFKPVEEARRYPPTFLPERWTLGNYETILRYPDITRSELSELQERGEARDVVPLAGAWREGQSFPRGYRNIVLITVLAATGAVVISSMAAYAIGVIRFRGSDIVFLTVLATLMVPWMVVLLPRFVLFRTFGLVGTPLPLFVPELFGGWALAMFFYRQHFLSTPRDILDAARIDGANEWQIYRRVMMPLARPVSLAVAVLILLTKWSDLIGPLIYLDDPIDAVPTQILYKMVQITGNENDPLAIGARMAGAVLIVLPILVFFFMTQKHFVRGLTQGALKE